ncbi:DUF362 domain-containing protein [bacterium]|nr:DUF362 domain-containing protein [candidate division CSSED10-310 bacterium]
MLNKVALRKLSPLNGDPVRFPQQDIVKLKDVLHSMFLDIGISPSFFRNQTVLLHPNFVRPNPSVTPASSTDPRVVLAIVECLKEYGATKIQVGENPGFGFSSRRAFELLDLIRPLKTRNVELCFFDEGEWVNVENDKGLLFTKIKIAKPVLDADVFINIPKWKTHMLTNVSLGIKNLLGCIHDDQRMLFHRNDINEKIVDLALACTPDITILDGIWAMEGQAPFHGEAIKDFNGLLVGRDVLAVDLTAAHLMGFDESEIPHVMIAKQRLWDSDIKVQIIGDSFESLFRRFKRPVLSSAGQFPGINCVECGVCIGCLSAIRHSLDKLRVENNDICLPEVTILSGRPMMNNLTMERWKGELILFGNCASEFQFYDQEKRCSGKWLSGCPPHVLDLYKLLIKHCENDRRDS